jgi:hypothetical protein
MTDERDERDDDTIDEQELPPAGNSKGRLYPPADKDEAGADGDDDPQQAPHGDAAAVRGGGPGPNDAE